MSFAKVLLPFALIAIGAFGATKPEADDRVWITRPDGSLQCDEKTEGTAHDPVAEAKAELTKKGVHVLDSKKSNDGKMRAQVCGISTGNETSFLIPKKELTKAKSLGFEAVR